MRRAACPGSFDPLTHGHLDIVDRASRLFDEVLLAVGTNDSKSRLFDAEERLEMATRAVTRWSNVTVTGFDGLLTDFCAARDVHAIVKGVRTGGDFDYELQMAQMNAALTGVETVLLPTSPARSFVSSSLVKEVARHGGDVSGFVPDFVLDRLTERLAGRS